jgi:putative flippase GtrA
LRFLLRFIVVGAVGFGIDAGVMTLVLRMGYDVVVARVVSFSMAVSATYFLNRAWTFSASKRPFTRAQYALYVTTQLVGALINLGTFFLAVSIVPALRESPVVALAIGAAVAMLFNFIVSRNFVFRSTQGAGR